MGRSSSWQGASPSSLTLGLIWCPEPSQVFLLAAASSEGFSRGFLSFVVFCLFCSAVFLPWVCFVNEMLHFPELRAPSWLLELPRVVEPLSVQEHPSHSLLWICFFHGALNLPSCWVTFREPPSAFPGASWVLLHPGLTPSPPLTPHSLRCYYCSNTWALLLLFLLEKKNQPTTWLLFSTLIPSKHQNFIISEAIIGNDFILLPRVAIRI